MNNAIAFAKEIKRKKHAVKNSNSDVLKRQYNKSIKRDIGDLKYYCKAKELNFDVVWKKAKEGD